MPCRAASCGARVNDSHSPPQQKAGRRPHGWVLSMSGSSELGSSLRFCFPGLPHSCPLGLLSGLMTDCIYEPGGRPCHVEKAVDSSIALNTVSSGPSAPRLLKPAPGSQV